MLPSSTTFRSATIRTRWKFRRASSDSSIFNLMLALVLAITVVIVPKAAPYNQVLLLPGILLVARDWRILWQKNRLSRILLTACGLLVFWPWLAATALTIASLGLPADVVQKAWAWPVWTSLAIPLIVAGLLARLVLSDARDVASYVSTEK